MKYSIHSIVHFECTEPHMKAQENKAQVYEMCLGWMHWISA